MSTANQLVGNFYKDKLREPKYNKRSRAKKLDNCPQKSGRCIKIRIVKPKKPNSAQRKVAKVKLSSDKFIIGYIAGFGNNLRDHSQVLVRGGNVPDLPGVHYRLIKGVKDFGAPEDILRKHRRSIYGVSMKIAAEQAEIFAAKEQIDIEPNKKKIRISHRMLRRNFLPKLK